MENLSEKPKKVKKEFCFSQWGYTQNDFKKWGKLGGRPTKYANNQERWRAYRRRKAQARIDRGEAEGILNMRTGRVNKKKKRG